jgi:hypothetical protein
MSGFVQAQSLERNRITVSGGWARQLYVDSEYRQTAPVVGLSYGYRAFKFMEFEAGVAVGLQPGQDLCNRFGCYDPNDRYIWIPIGVRFIAPLVAGRLEFSGGGGGLIQRYSVSNPDNPYNIATEDGLGGYFSAGAAVALDRRHRFWFGATPRALLANPEFRRYRWFTITGDLSFRF